MATVLENYEGDEDVQLRSGSLQGVEDEERVQIVGVLEK
jgi:hypothetical protein